MLERSAHNLAEYSAVSQSLTGRRVLFGALVVSTTIGMVWLMGLALSVGGFGILDAIILVLFCLTVPWNVIGFWNSLIGFLIIRFSRDPVATVTPVAARVRGNEPISASTAILICIRNEIPTRVIRNVEPMMAGLVAAGVADRFKVYILSDTNKPDVAVIEEEQFKQVTANWRGKMDLIYRRRTSNEGFKAGNIREFCERWGDAHEFAVVLDIDSLMPAEAVLRLVRIMQVEPKLGILQTLVIALPTMSAFARLFQFGMRLSMRAYTVGSAWWQGDCGPYWGHNAIIRIAPFFAHCKMPVLSGDGPLSGEVLSHDQIESTFMRRAGYEVRVLTDEDFGWEENPPTLIQFTRRDLRWCQGNMQYWRLIATPGLKPVSRYQLGLALLMFVGSPAWIALLILGTLVTAVANSPADVIDPSLGIAMLVLVLVIGFMPKITTAIDILLRPELRHAYGGPRAILTNITIDAVFSLLLRPIMWFGHTLFLIGLLLGRGIGWIGQVRDHHGVPLAVAAQDFWLHTLLGWAVIAILALTHPAAIPIALLIAGGLAFSIPLAVVTAMPSVGIALARAGFGRLPEETSPPPMLKTLALPAIDATQRIRAPSKSIMFETLRTARGVLRSLWTYYGHRDRSRAMDSFYRRFVQPGDLMFDVGAHVGDHIATFRRLGTRVVAVEPQPVLARVLRLIYGRDSSVAIEQSAIGGVIGSTQLMINLDNPTISTASKDFMQAADGAKGWEGEAWTKSISVPVTTLDALIAKHGVPAFIKIDVEGFEAEALAGLTQAVASLSFEFTTIQRDVALACIERCSALGYQRFNAALGDIKRLVHDDWIDRERIARWLIELPHAANSGDIYASRA